MIRKTLPLRALWTSRALSLYAKFVHNALFLELVAHEVPQGALLALMRLLEQHENLVILALAAAFSVWQHTHDTGDHEGPPARRRRARRSQEREDESTISGAEGAP